MATTQCQPEAKAVPAAGRIARSTGVIALTTALSRVLGVIRDQLFANYFGTSIAAEAFVVAFRLPNMLRDLVGEGAVTSAIVPVLSRYRAKNKGEEFWPASQALLGRVLVALGVIGLLGVFLAEPFVRLTAPGFAADPEKLRLTIRLTRILFPFITLVGLWAYFMGVLNSLQRFAVPSLGSAILNMAMIASLIWFVRGGSTEGVVIQAWSVLVGGLLQLAVQIPPAMRLGFRWRLRWRHPGVTEALRLLGPRVLGSAVYQVNVLIDTALASMTAIVGLGAVSALYYASRLVQLPMALFGTASAQASLPALSDQAAREDWGAFRNTLLGVIRMVGFVILPSAVGLIVLGGPIVSVLFERGAFDRHSTLMTTQALACYALGLWAYSASKVVTGAFYALHDTRTPVRLAAEAVAINFVLSLLLMGPLKLAGLALAASFSNILNAHRLLRRLEARLAQPLIRPLYAPLGRIGAAALVMGGACVGLRMAFGDGIRTILGLSAALGMSGLVYLLSVWAFRVPELATFQRWVLPKWNLPNRTR